MKYSMYIIVLFILSSCYKKNEEQYFENGNLKLVAEVNNGQWHGEVKNYFETGELEALQIYENGVVHGKSIYYFPNGNISSINHWVHGKKNGDYKKFYNDGSLNVEGKFYNDHLVDTLKFYYNNGNLMEIQLFDSLGILVDFYKYDENGSPKLDLRRPIFIPDKDTVIVGEKYEIEIRAANTVFDSLQIVIGELDNSGSLDWNKPYELLPQKSDNAFLFIFEPNHQGKYLIQGVINDIKSGDTLLIHEIPFEKYYYVISATGASL